MIQRCPHRLRSLAYQLGSRLCVCRFTAHARAVPYPNGPPAFCDVSQKAAGERGGLNMRLGCHGSKGAGFLSKLSPSKINVPNVKVGGEEQNHPFWVKFCFQRKKRDAGWGGGSQVHLLHCYTCILPSFTPVQL